MLEASTYVPLIVEVNDRRPGLKQKVRLRKTTINEEGDALWIKLALVVSLFDAAADGSYGELATGNGINEYPVMLIADNNCAVDPASGVPAHQLLTAGAVKNMATGEITLLAGQSFRDYIEALPTMYKLQGDWFADQLENPKASVRQLQQYFVLAADQPPYSKFSASKVVDLIPQPLPSGSTLSFEQAQQMGKEGNTAATEPAAPAGPTSEPEPAPEPAPAEPAKSEPAADTAPASA